MRLIDADTLKLNFLHLQEHIIQAYGEIDEYVRCLDNAIETYIDVNYFKSIEEAPTIDAEPVRYGHWVLEREPDGNPYCFHCSVCDDDFHIIGIKSATKYCPNCGAKMDYIISKEEE